MNIELLHQNLERTVSFKDRISDLFIEENINIICPYLTLSILEEITKASKSWRLITDIKSLFLSTKKSNHNSLLEFIKSNTDKIKSIDNTHAKAIISNDKAFFGSANFTNNGLNKNIELSGIIEDSSKVSELNNWFNDLWSKSSFLNIEKVSSFVNSISINIVELNEKYELINFDKNDNQINYFVDLGDNFKIHPPLKASGKRIDDLDGRKHNKFTIWGNDYSVIISNKEIKTINFDSLSIDEYTKFLNEKISMYIENKKNLIPQNTSIHSSSPIILGALLGFYKLIANKPGKNHNFYISNSEIDNLSKLEKLGFIYSKSGDFIFDTGKIDLRKHDKENLLKLVERYYQLYINNSIMDNPRWDKESSIYRYWQKNTK